MPLTIIAGPGSRLYAPPVSPPGGAWADSYVTNASNVAAALATAGNTVGVRANNLADLSQQLTAGNGATMDIVTNGSFDSSENAMRILPPTALVGGESQYACIFRFMDLWNGGATDIAQINFRWLSYFGPRYFDLGSPTKFHGFLAASSLGGDLNQRQAVWEARDPLWSNWKYLGTTSNSVMNFYNPYDPDWYHIDSAPDTSKLCQIGSSASHGSNPPRIGDEWVCFETVIDLRQDRGNAFGMNKLLLWTRDGLVSAKYIQAPANRDAAWNFIYRYLGQIEGFGFYWNTAGTAHADNYALSSHWTFAANKAVNQVIGPPPGFVL